MAYNIRKNWVESLDLMVKRPIVLLPFLFIAFLEGLALELIYFSSSEPLAYIINPIVRKFFGESFLHYPGNLFLLPQLLYYAKILIYIFIGALLAAICASLVRAIRMNLALKADALIKNALKHYASFFVFGLVMVTVLFLIKELGAFVFSNAVGLLSLALFVSNVILQTFLVLTIPIIVVKNKTVFKALGQSIILGGRNFLSLFILILFPFLIYFPVILLKVATPRLIGKSFPEMTLYIESGAIIFTVLVECFIMVCATQFLLDKENGVLRKLK